MIWIRVFVAIVVVLLVMGVYGCLLDRDSTDYSKPAEGQP
jgi:hypothetical protein